MADPDGQDREGAFEAQPGYTHNPWDTRDRQSSRFDRSMVRVSRQRKLTQQSSRVCIPRTIASHAISQC